MRVRNAVLAVMLLAVALFSQACATGMVTYRTPVCAGQLTQEYGWRPHWSGNGLEYVPTGRLFCNGQILY